MEVPPSPIDVELDEFAQQLEVVFKKAVLGRRDYTDKAIILKLPLACQLCSHFRSALLLVKNDQEEEALILLRCMTDLVIRLGYLSQFPEHARFFLLTGKKKSAQRAKSYLEHRVRQMQTAGLSSEERESLELAEGCLRETKEQLKVSPEMEKTRELARRIDEKTGGGGFLGLYYAQFALFSDNVHAHHNALERYLHLDSQGKFEAFILRPASQNRNFVIYHSCSLFLMGWLVSGIEGSDNQLRQGESLRQQLEHFSDYAART